MTADKKTTPAAMREFFIDGILIPREENGTLRLLGQFMYLNPKNLSSFPAFTRIISLVPSITELLSDLDLNNEVVGITKFCVHPARWYREKTRIGGTKDVNLEKIEKLTPDLVIANKEENEKQQVEELAKSYNVLLTDVYDLESAIEMIDDIGGLSNRKQESFTMIQAIMREFDTIRFQHDKIKKPTAAYFIWQKPYMVAGGDTFISDMMKWCGYENIYSDKKRYPQITLNELGESDCRTILLSSEPFPFKDEHMREIKKLLPRKKVKLVDAEMFSWYGSRLLKAPGYFKTFIHDEQL